MDADLTTADVERYVQAAIALGVQNYRERFDSLVAAGKSSAEVAALCGDIDEAVEKELRRAKTWVQAQTGGEQAWREYWTTQNMEGRQRHEAVAGGWGGVHYRDEDVDWHDRPHVHQFEIVLNEAGDYAGIKPC